MVFVYFGVIKGGCFWVYGNFRGRILGLTKGYRWGDVVRIVVIVGGMFRFFRFCGFLCCFCWKILM